MGVRGEMGKGEMEIGPFYVFCFRFPFPHFPLFPFRLSAV